MSKEKSRLTPFVKQCLVTLAVNLNNISQGSGMGLPSVMLPQLRTPGSTIHLTLEQESWIASTIGVAMFLGNPLTVPLLEQLGRRVTLLIIAFITVIGWIIIAASNDYYIMVTGRAIQGVAIGLLMPTIGMVLGEYTSPRHRGSLLSTISLSQGLGVLVVHLLGSLLPWEYTCVICSLFPLASFAMIIFIPESPSWLAMQGRYKDCQKAFRSLRGHDEEEELAKLILSRQQFDLKRNREFNKLKFHQSAASTIAKREFYLPIILAFNAYMIAMVCGTLTLASYADKILPVLIGKCNIDMWLVSLDLVRLIFNVLAIWVVHRMRRRTMLFTAGATCVLVHISLPAYVWARDTGIISDMTWLPGSLIVLQFITVAMGMITLPFTIVGEIFPLQYRSMSNCITTTLMSSGVFLLLKTFPGLYVRVGLAGAYLVYGGVMLFGLLVLWVWLPETKDRTLQEIEEYFRGEPLVADDVTQSLKVDFNRTEKMLK